LISNSGHKVVDYVNEDSLSSEREENVKFNPCALLHLNFMYQTIAVKFWLLILSAFTFIYNSMPTLYNSVR
jgi:hypothetical protein